MHYDLQAPGSDLIDLYIHFYRALDFVLIRFALTHLQRLVRIGSNRLLYCWASGTRSHYR